MGGPMRRLCSFVVALCILFVGTCAYSKDSQDYQADEKRILACIEAAEKSRDQLHIDLTQRCVGNEMEYCDRTTEHNTYESNRRMYCAVAEAAVWNALMEKAYSKLLEWADKCDKEKCTVFKSETTQYEPMVDALKAAHAAWLTSKEAHCELVRIQAGSGTDRYDGPARCELYDVAERALVYRVWTAYSIR
jgi:uncharacterized protein YecT (DUF1311 family)